MGTFKSVLITKQTNKYEYGFIFLLLITHLRNDSPQMRSSTEYMCVNEWETGRKTVEVVKAEEFKYHPKQLTVHKGGEDESAGRVEQVKMSVRRVL